MKYALMILCLSAVMSTQAQEISTKEGPNGPKHHERMKNLSPVERAQLKTKKMTLHLDLNESQQQQVYALNLDLEQNRPERKQRRSEAKEDLYQMASARLDRQIATRAKLKEILSESQFEKFSEHYKERKKMRRSKGRKKQH